MAKRVLLVNKFYYPRGGDCIVVLNTEGVLRLGGLEAEVFAMEFQLNQQARYSDLFAPEVSFGGGAANQLRALWRTLGIGDVRKRFEAVLDEYQPDVVHLHNIHSYISPVVGQLAHKRGIRVVWTMHDYKLLCPRYDCLLDGKPCERCHQGDKFNVITHKCMKGSLPASVVAWIEALKWNRKVLQKFTDVFVCPSQFIASKMRAGGFDEAKIKVLNNFLDPVKLQRYQELGQDSLSRQDYYCYVGRLSQEKGVEALLEAASSLPYPLKVAGRGPLETTLRDKYSKSPNIEFLGNLNADEVAQLLARARFSIMPSRCYDNNPLSVVESLCAGTPVVGAHIGGIPELIDDSSGIAFKPFDTGAMSHAISAAMDRQWNHTAIAQAALNRFSPTTHLQSLLNDIYAL